MERIRRRSRNRKARSACCWASSRCSSGCGGGAARKRYGDQGVPLTPGTRSIAVDKSLHVYGTPFFIQAGLPLTSEKRTASFDRLMIAQDTGSAIVGPARADIFWGAGDGAGRVAGRIRHPGSFAMLVPREIDPSATRVPLPPERPRLTAEARVRTPLPKSPAQVQGRRFSQAVTSGRDLRSRTWLSVPRSERARRRPEF